MEKISNRINALKITRVGVGYSIFVPLLIIYLSWLFSNVPIELGFLNKLLYLLIGIREFDIDHCIFCFMFEVIRWVMVFIMAVAFSMIFSRYSWKAVLAGVILFFLAINGRLVAYNIGKVVADIVKDPKEFKYIWADKEKYKLPYDFFVKNKDRIRYVELYSEVRDIKDIVRAYEDIGKQARALYADGFVAIFGQTRDVGNYPDFKYAKHRASGSRRVAFGTAYLDGNSGKMVEKYKLKLTDKDENNRLIAIIDITEIDHYTSIETLLEITKKRAAYGESGYLDYIYALDGLAMKKNESIYPEILRLSEDKNSVDRAIRMLANYPEKKETMVKLEEIAGKTESKITKTRALNAINLIKERAGTIGNVTQDQVSKGQFKIPENITYSDSVYLDEKAYRDAIIHEMPISPNLEKGKLLLKQGKADEAIEELLAAEKAGRGGSSSMYLADAYEKIRNYEKALEYFILYLDNYVSWQAREHLFYRARYLERVAIGDYNGAIEIAEQGLKEYCKFYNHKNPFPSDTERLEDLKTSKEYILNKARIL